jgi:hypothetical protein
MGCCDKWLDDPMVSRKFALRRINPMLLQHGIFLEVDLASYSRVSKSGNTTYENATIDWEVTFSQTISSAIPDMSR